MKYRSMLEGKLNETSMSKVSDKDIPDRKEADWCTKTYRVKVITPIYGGGVNAGEPDEDMPIRASAIRGQLRYWWRFLAMNRKEDKLQGEELFKEERRIWGGMGDEKELKELNEKDFSSKVFVKVMNIQNFNKKKDIQPCGRYQRKVNPNTGNISYPFYFDHSIPPYSLFCAQGKSPKAGGDGTPEENPHNIIRSGVSFDLKISCFADTDWVQIKEAVRWWLCFGGIGARTRRGLGSVYSDDIDSLDSEEVKKYGCILKEIDAVNEIDAWGIAISRLHEFRQSPEGRNGMGRSKWPEPDSIRDITTNRLKHEWEHPIEHKSIRSFPRASFGLPIIFEIKGTNEPPKTQLEPLIEGLETARMSSTIILKALKTKTGSKAIALKLPVAHLDDLRVKLDYVNLSEVGNKELLKELDKKLPLEFARTGENVWWPESEENQRQKAEYIAPMKNNEASNALDAFMSYFEKGGK